MLTFSKVPALVLWVDIQRKEDISLIGIKYARLLFQTWKTLM